MPDEKLAATYLREEVVVDLHAAVREQLGEVDRGAGEEVVAHYVRHHLLVQVAVVHLLPVGVLQQKPVAAVSKHQGSTRVPLIYKCRFFFYFFALTP